LPPVEPPAGQGGAETLSAAAVTAGGAEADSLGRRGRMTP